MKKPATSLAFTQAMPVILGYLPLGFAYGVMAKNALIPAWAALLMSVIVYAGSSQYIATGMFAAGIDPMTMAVTTFVVNFRHFLMSVAVSPYVSKWRKWQRIVFGLQLTDETFAIQSTQFVTEVPTPAHALWENLFCHLTWILSSVAGFFAKSMIGPGTKFGIEFALPAMFVGLISLQAKTRRLILAGASGAVFTVLFVNLGLGSSAILVAALAAATGALFLEKWERRQ